MGARSDTMGRVHSGCEVERTLHTRGLELSYGLSLAGSLGDPWITERIAMTQRIIIRSRTDVSTRGGNLDAS